MIYVCAVFSNKISDKVKCIEWVGDDFEYCSSANRRQERTAGANLMRQRFREKLHQVEFLWTLIKTFPMFLKLSIDFSWVELNFTLGFVTWNWPPGGCSNMCKFIATNAKDSSGGNLSLKYGKLDLSIIKINPIKLTAWTRSEILSQLASYTSHFIRTNHWSSCVT